MRLLARLARGAGLASLVAAAFIAVPTVATATTPVVGHVYVNDNTAGTNTIGAFDQHSDGSLTTMAGSPFSAGGAGTGTITGSQGSIQSTADGNWVLAVDAGSNQISVLAIGANGSLTPAPGSPVSSGGLVPVSIAVHGGLVYVANKGNGTSGSNKEQATGQREIPKHGDLPTVKESVWIAANYNTGPFSRQRNYIRAR